MRKPAPWVTFLVILIILIALTLLLTVKTRPYPAWDTDVVHALKDKPYSAAQTFLEQSGHKVSVLKNFNEFKPKSQDQNQLLVVFKQNLRTQKGQDKLLDWVGQGNHLLIPMEDYFASLSALDFEKDDSEKDINDLAELPLTSVLGVAHGKVAQNAQKTPLSREEVDPDWTDIEDDEYDENEPQSSTAKEDFLKQVDALGIQKQRNIDDQKPLSACIQSLDKRLQADAAVTVDKKKIVTLEQVYTPGQTIGQLKALWKDEAETKASPLTFLSEKMDLVTCSENMVTLPLSSDKMIQLLFNQEVNKLSLVYVGKEKPLLEGKNTYGTQLIRVPYKKGSITIIPKSYRSFLIDPILPTHDTNSVRQFDHAYFLAYLSQGKSEVFFLPRALDYIQKQPKPSLLKALYQKAPELLMVLIVFMLLFVWMQMYRNGPILAQLNTARRNLKEHFHAQGEFLRRHVDSNVLIGQLQDDIWQKVQRRLPNIKNLPIDMQKKELARLTRLNESTFSTLLMPMNNRISILELMRYIIALQKIRNKL